MYRPRLSLGSPRLTRLGSYPPQHQLNQHIPNTRAAQMEQPISHRSHSEVVSPSIWVAVELFSLSKFFVGSIAPCIDLTTALIYGGTETLQKRPSALLLALHPCSPSCSRKTPLSGVGVFRRTWAVKMTKAGLDLEKFRFSECTKFWNPQEIFCMPIGSH